MTNPNGDDALPPQASEVVDGTALIVQGPGAHPETIRKKVRSAAAIERREKIKAALELMSGGTPPAVAIRRSGLTPRMFFKVLRASPSLDRAYELSRQAGAQVLADQGLMLAAHLSRQDNVSPSKVMSLKLRLDYLRWYIGKLYPDTFDDRLAGDKGGGKNSLTVVVVMDDRKPSAD
jgi:hypothetical protein